MASSPAGPFNSPSRALPIPFTSHQTPAHYTNSHSRYPFTRGLETCCWGGRSIEVGCSKECAPHTRQSSGPGVRCTSPPDLVVRPAVQSFSCSSFGPSALSISLFASWGGRFLCASVFARGAVVDVVCSSLSRRGSHGRVDRRLLFSGFRDFVAVLSLRGRVEPEFVSCDGFWLCRVRADASLPGERTLGSTAEAVCGRGLGLMDGVRSRLLWNWDSSPVVQPPPFFPFTDRL